MFFSKLVSATVATVLLAGTALGDDTVGAGKVKSIDTDNKTFVLTDSADKDWNFSFGALLVVNRNGKESKSELKAGDAINVCYDKGTTLTAHYILVQQVRQQELHAGARQRQELRCQQEGAGIHRPERQGLRIVFDGRRPGARQHEKQQDRRD